MQVDFNDEAHINRAFQQINRMKVQTEEEMRASTMRTMLEEVR